jgi:hypothetical protein
MPGMAVDISAPDVRFKDLCLDASDPHELAAFWTRLLHRDLVSTNDGGWRVLPDGPEATGIWVDPVPEPRTGKTRVHLDLRLPSDDVTPLLEAGAVLVHDRTDEQRWWVLADPDGNLFCAMPPAPPEWGAPPVDHATPFEINVDCTDAEAQATWWAARTGGEAKTRGGPFWWVEGAAGFPWYAWVFGTVPEPKTVKNRMHWDVVLRDDSPQALLDAGATLLRERGDGPDDTDWWVLADPEGNEFCAFLAGT